MAGHIPKDILIRHAGEKIITPHTTFRQATDTTRCIHITYIAEGYTDEEMNAFLEDVRTADEAMFAHEPFKTMKDRFHITAVMSPSHDSGTSEPAGGLWKNTALDSLLIAFLHILFRPLPYHTPPQTLARFTGRHTI